MPTFAHPGMLCVAVRELRWMWRDKVAIFLVVGIPLIAFALLAATFSNAVIRDLRIDVVDKDRTQTSMTFVQAINSAPGVTIAQRSTDLNGAMHAIRSGEAIAAVYIPEHLERDILAARRPADRHLLQQAIFHPGQHRVEALQAAISAATAALPPVPRPPAGSRRGRWSSSSMC